MILKKTNPNSGGPKATCRLCLIDTPLAQSHIIPEFIFSRMYDKKHRYLELFDVNAGRIRLGQKGYRERLLCPKCESKVNRYEQHSRRLFVDDLPRRESPKSRRICIKNLDYRLFKLFLLSVLWRASISSLPMFEYVKLGPHEEKIRLILESENPGAPRNYPCLVFPLLFDGEHFKGYMVTPTFAKVEGHKCYRFVFGGFVFMFFVSSHSLPSKFEKILLTNNIPLFLYPTELSEFAFLRDVWNRAKDSTRDVVTPFGD